MDVESIGFDRQSVEWFADAKMTLHNRRNTMQNTMLDSAISNSLQLFQNPAFKVRVIMRCAEPWFVAKDVATCIEHSDTSAMCKLCRDKDKVVINGKEYSDDLSEYSEGRGNPNITLISESGLYRILAKCNLPKCEPFESWVFDEVLPSIRKTGSYGVSQISRKDQLFLAIIHSESEEERADALKELAEINKQEVKSLTAERDEAIRTKTQYQSNLASQMSGRVGGLTAALNRARTENDRLKGDRFTVDDIYIIMNTSDVSFTLKDPKAVIRESLNLFSKEMGEPFPKLPIKQKEINGKMMDVTGFVYTTKAVQAYFEFVEANPMGWQARNRKMIMYGWLREKLIKNI